MDQLPNTIRSHWNGEQPLWKSFWVYGLLVGTLSVFLIGPGVSWFLAEIESDAVSERYISTVLDLYAILLMLGFSLSYNIWNFVSVWRCARNAKRLLWKWSARTSYVIEYGLIVVAFILEYPTLS